MSLQARLAILVSAAILPLALLSAGSAVRDMRRDTQTAQAQLKLAASLVAVNQDRMVDATRDLLMAISLMPELRRPVRESCQRYFENLRGHYPVYINIGLLHTGGQLLCHANAGQGDASVADRSYFRQALAQREFVMGEPITEGLSGRRGIPFAMPVLEGQTVTAVLFAVLDLAQASKELARLELPPGARVLVADRRARVLMEYPPRPDLPAGRALADPGAQEGARQGTAGIGEGPDAQGAVRVYAFVPSRPVGAERFLASVSVEKQLVARDSVSRLRDDLFALGASLLAGLAGAGWIGRRAIVKPARQILGAVKRLEQGDLDARIPLRGGRQHSEFARIGAAFNLMAESLRLRQIDLEAELGRSRSAHGVLEQVLNSMQEGLMAVSGTGLFLMFNQAAARLFPLHGPAVPPGKWAVEWGLYHLDQRTLYGYDDLPLARAMRGETGWQQPLFVRNSLVPEGRLLYCSFQPMRGDGGISGSLVVFTDVTELQRLQAERAAQFAELRETQRRLVEAQRIGRMGNWELDVPSGRLWWSDEVYELFGLRREDFAGSFESFIGRVHPHDRPLVNAAREAALGGGDVMNVEYRIIRPDGTLAWMHEIAETRTGSDGARVWFGGVVQDIGERKEAERALMDSERELQDFTRLLQRNANATRAIAAGRSIGATLQAVVDQAREVIGTRQAVLTLTGGEGGTAAAAQARSGGEDGGTAIPQSALRVPLLEPSGRTIGLLELLGKNGAEFNQRDEYVAVELAQLASIAIDNARLFQQIRELNAGLEARILERTAELSQQEARYRALVEQAPVLVWNVDPRGRTIFLNKAWENLVGRSAEASLGYHWLEHLHPDDRAAVAANWEKSRQSLQPFSGTRRLRARDGTYHTMSYRGAPALDAEGKALFWVGIDTDITEYKAIENALRSSNQELEAFSYSVSHDLRAPLGAIGGFSRALSNKLQGLVQDERATHYLARIQAGVEKMEQLIDALLSLAKVVRAPLSYGGVDLGEMAKEALAGLRERYPQRRVGVVVQDGLTAHGDARLLHVLMENLLGNAWKFSSQREDARIEVGKLEGTGTFFVRDNGVGFDMAYADKLFGAFQRLHTEAEFPGTGIGLATVRRIIARHQGRVWAQSRLGEGATFFFTLSESAPLPWLAGDGPL